MAPRIQNANAILAHRLYIEYPYLPVEEIGKLLNLSRARAYQLTNKYRDERTAAQSELVSRIGELLNAKQPSELIEKPRTTYGSLAGNTNGYGGSQWKLS